MNFIQLKTEKEVKALLASLSRSELVALDTESTGLDPRKDKLTSVVMALDDETAYTFPAEFVHLMRDINACRFVLQNFKHDFHFLHHAGIEMLHHVTYDTMLLHHLWDENKSHGLDSMVQEFYADNYKEVFWSKYKSITEAPEAERVEYECKDAIYTRRLYGELRRQLSDNQVPDSLIEHVHHLARALFLSEQRGVLVDLPYLSKLGTELSAQIETLKAQIKATVPRAVASVELDDWARELGKRKTDKGKAGVPRPEFNLDSNKQLGVLLYDKLRLSEQKKENKRTTDDAALTQLEKEHAIIPLIKEYRGHQKIFTSFVEGTLDKQIDGRIYPSFNVNGTVTGRISSSSPNMQQLPRDGGVRGMYIPEPGYRFITCDYQQLEIVLAAHFSNDPVLLDIVREGKSMHDHTAKEVGIERQAAKTVNFLCIYGGTEYRLSAVLKVSVEEAKRILITLWKTYAGLKGAIDECHKRVAQGLPIVNALGRQRHFPQGLQGKELQRAQRQGFNAKVQGTGADLTHESFWRVGKRLEEAGVGYALFPVHDEIVIMAKENACNEAAEMLQFEMIQAGIRANLQVPLRVDCSDPLERWEK